MAFPIQPPIKQFSGLDGKPLDFGFLYFGLVNQDPQTSPATVYWDAAGLVPAAQPIRTVGGYPSRGGTPTNVYARTDCSMTVRDKNGNLVITKFSSAEIGFVGSSFSPEYFGAAGDGVTDDHLAVQAALDTKFCQFTHGTQYNLGTVGVTVKNHGTVVIGNNAGLLYSGSGHAFDAAPVSGSYPQNCIFSDFYIDCSASVSSGIRFRFSYSHALGLTSVVRASNSTAWRIDTDFLGGSGPYYNLIENCHAVGKVGIIALVANQTGWLFTADPSYPGRGPNANTFMPGRTSDFTNPWVICGAGNTIIHPKIEGTPSGGQIFTFENAYGGGAGCIDNHVLGGYIEGQPGANFIKFGTNSSFCHVERPYFTSLGAGAYKSDTSGNNTNTTVDPYGFQLANTVTSDLRTIDYYDEGLIAFTPTIAGSTTAGAHTYSIQRGVYQRVGNTVHFQVGIALSAKDAAMAGNCRILGLPFVSSTSPANNYAGMGIGHILVTNSVGYTYTGARIDPGANYVWLVENGSGVAPQILPQTGIAANFELFFEGSYTV